MPIPTFPKKFVKDDCFGCIGAICDECYPMKKVKSIYLIGSLRNDAIPEIADLLSNLGVEAFADWWGAGPEADDWWKTYNEKRGVDYFDALNGYAAQTVFNFDKTHLDRCDAGLLVLPAGRSGHLELGYTVGRGKPAFILADDKLGVERWDVMYAFATKVFRNTEEMVDYFVEADS